MLSAQLVVQGHGAALASSLPIPGATGAIDGAGPICRSEGRAGRFPRFPTCAQ